MEGLFGPTDPAKVEAGAERRGLRGEKVSLMAGADNPATSVAGQVVADLARADRLQRRFPAADWGTIIQRRTSREPADKGGWSLFIVGYAGFDIRARPNPP